MNTMTGRHASGSNTWKIALYVLIALALIPTYQLASQTIGSFKQAAQAVSNEAP
jgi:hypothetical protein